MFAIIVSALSIAISILSVVISYVARRRLQKRLNAAFIERDRLSGMYGN